MVAPARCAAAVALAALCTASSAGTAHHLSNRTVEGQDQHHRNRSESSAVRGLVPPVSAGGGLLEVTQKFTDFMIEKFTGDLTTLVSSIPAPLSHLRCGRSGEHLLTRC